MLSLPSKSYLKSLFEDVEHFFSSMEKTCADCQSAAEWASVSYGVYLCALHVYMRNMKET